MNQGEDSGLGIDMNTMRGRDWPSVRQFSIFVDNRVGGMLDVVRRVEQSGNHIVSVGVVDTADCAIIRLVLRDPERAVETFKQAKLPFTESDLLVVQLPNSAHPLLTICKALLATEMNIHYVYPLWIDIPGHNAIALHVEDHDTAATTLTEQGFTLLSENDL